MKREDIFVGSLDTVALYPSLVISEVGKICADKVKQSEIKFENVDMMWAAKYVALALDEDEVTRRGDNDIIPRRKARQGRKATMRTVVVEDKNERWKFFKSPSMYSK